MCSRRALWCFSASPQRFHTARCSPSASTGHISSEGHNTHNEWFPTSEIQLISVRRDLFFTLTNKMKVNLLSLSPPGWWSWRWFPYSAPIPSSKSPRTLTWEDPEQLYKLWAGCSPETGEWWNIFTGKMRSILYKLPTTPWYSWYDWFTDTRHW